MYFFDHSFAHNFFNDFLSNCLKIQQLQLSLEVNSSFFTPHRVMTNMVSLIRTREARVFLVLARKIPQRPNISLEIGYKLS